MIQIPSAPRAAANRLLAAARRLLNRIGNPLAWDAVDKVLIIQVIQAPMVLVAMTRARYLMAHPDVEPYFARDVMSTLTTMLTGFLGLTLLLTLVGVAVRRRRRGVRLYLYVVTQSWFLFYAGAGYLHGLATTPVWAVFPFIGFYCLLLFDTKPVVIAMVTGVTVMLGATVAERMGWLPYAPLFAAPPTINGRVANPWLWSSMLWPIVSSAISFPLFVFFLRRSRQQAELLAVTAERLRAELQEAAQYVRSILPRPLEEPDGVMAEWAFTPSAQLGGDAFTYAWIGDDDFMIALLDVCGHGVGPALHGISALHVLRPRGLGGVDLRDPAAVVTAMNEAFAMEDHNDLYLSLWYGVYHRPDRRLRFVSAGHPPAILRTGPTRAQAGTRELTTRGVTVGVFPEATFAAQEVALDAFAELFVFSDGAFEIERPGAGELAWEDFVAALEQPPAAGMRKVDDMLHFAKRFGERDQLEDDFSLVRVEFADGRRNDKTAMTAEITARDDDLSRIRDLVDELAHTRGLPADVVADVQVVLDEVLSNILRHGFRDDRSHAVRVALRLARDELIIEVEDDCVPFDPLSVPPPDVDAPLDERPIGGLGVHLVKSLMDTVQHHAVGGHNQLVLRKRLGGRA